MHREIIFQLVEECWREFSGANGSGGLIRDRLHEKISLAMRGLPAREFVNDVRDDEVFASCYYDVQQAGACAKAGEVAAQILEAIVMDALEESSDQRSRARRIRPGPS